MVWPWRSCCVPPWPWAGGEVSNILVLSLLYPVVLWGLNHIQVEIILQEKLIAVMLFGAIYGLGSGLTYRLGYSYGGTDTLAKLLKQRLFRTVPLKYLLLALDGGIMLLMLLGFLLGCGGLRLCGAAALCQLHEPCDL